MGSRGLFLVLLVGGAFRVVIYLGSAVDLEFLGRNPWGIYPVNANLEW